MSSHGGEEEEADQQDDGSDGVLDSRSLGESDLLGELPSILEELQKKSDDARVAPDVSDDDASNQAVGCEASQTCKTGEASRHIVSSDDETKGWFEESTTSEESALMTRLPHMERREDDTGDSETPDYATFEDFDTSLDGYIEPLSDIVPKPSDDDMSYDTRLSVLQEALLERGQEQGGAERRVQHWSEVPPLQPVARRRQAMETTRDTTKMGEGRFNDYQLGSLSNEEKRGGSKRSPCDLVQFEMNESKRRKTRASKTGVAREDRSIPPEKLSNFKKPPATSASETSTPQRNCLRKSHNIHYGRIMVDHNTTIMNILVFSKTLPLGSADSTVQNKKKNQKRGSKKGQPRGKYGCGKCGDPNKVGHICQSRNPKIKGISVSTQTATPECPEGFDWSAAQVPLKRRVIYASGQYKPAYSDHRKATRHEKFSMLKESVQLASWLLKAFLGQREQSSNGTGNDAQESGGHDDSGSETIAGDGNDDNNEVDEGGEAA